MKVVQLSHRVKHFCGGKCLEFVASKMKDRVTVIPPCHKFDPLKGFWVEFFQTVVFQVKYFKAEILKSSCRKLAQRIPCEMQFAMPCKLYAFHGVQTKCCDVGNRVCAQVQRLYPQVVEGSSRKLGQTVVAEVQCVQRQVPKGSSRKVSKQIALQPEMFQIVEPIKDTRGEGTWKQILPVNDLKDLEPCFSTLILKQII